MRSLKNLFLILILIACFGIFGCDLGEGIDSSGNSDIDGAISAATVATATYDRGSSSGISSVRVYYPKDSLTHLAVTLTGGFSNTKENMYWLAEYLSKNGFIVFAISASNNLSVGGYENAHKGGVNLIKSENTRSGSPIKGKVKSIGLTGYSMGGGAVANVGNSLGSQVTVVVGMAPYAPSSFLWSMKAPTVFLTGGADIIAPSALNALPAYNSLPSSLKKALVSIALIDHLAWMLGGPSGADEYICAWLKYYVDGDATYKSTLNNPPFGLSYTAKNL
jgi:hypothetical protein